MTRPETLDESESGNLELVVSMTSPSPGILTLWSRKRVRVREFGIDGLVTESGILVPKTTRTGLDLRHVECCKDSSYEKQIKIIFSRNKRIYRKI